MTQSSYFDEYRIEGKDDTGAILMSVSPEILAKSLCNTLGASSVKVKLAKKQSACLSVEIALPSPGKILFGNLFLSFSILCTSLSLVLLP